MLIAQITDLHIRPRGQPAYRVAETNMLVERAIDALMGLRHRPDVVLVTGDMTDCGLAEEYRQLRQMLKRLTVPTYMVPGNHDRRELFRQAFPDHPFMEGDQGFLQFVVEEHPVRLIGLDTVVPGASEGGLCETRLAFLEDALDRDADRPTIIFMHHPPFDCGYRHMDRIRLMEGADRFKSIVSGRGNVERVLCGHHHRPIHTRFAGTIASVAPGVAHQVALDFNEDFGGALVLEPPAFELHLYRPEIGLVSHMVYVERYPGPYPFVLEPDYPGSTSA